MANSTFLERNITIESAQNNGIVTNMERLLSSRYWAKKLSLFSKKAAKNSLLGNVRSRYRGRGMEFDEVRRYQAGDDIRNIDWRVTARANGTYTKIFCQERERPCHIIVDQRISMFFGSTIQFKSVLAAELAAALGWAALTGGDRVGAQVIGDSYEQRNRARRSHQAVLKLIHDLHEMNHFLLNSEQPKPMLEQQTQTQKARQIAPNELSNILEECEHIVRPGTAVFLISDFYDINDACIKALANLGKHTDITLLHIIDPLENQLPHHQDLAISDGNIITNINFSTTLTKAYEQSLATRLRKLKKAANLAKAHCMTISTAQTAKHALSQVYRS